MATTTAWAISLLDEAAAIVEAEWIRLQQDEALWERELADLAAEMPAPRPAPPGVRVTATARRWPGPPTLEGRRGWPTRRWPPTPIWATQRSPPRGPGCPCSNGTAAQKEVMPRPRISHRQRLWCRPH